MKTIIKKFILFIMIFFSFNNKLYASNFYTSDIKIIGLNNIKYKNIYNNIYLYKNKNISNYDINLLIKKIFKQGYFSNINTYLKDKNILVFEFTENPTIENINIYKNKILNTSIINDNLKENKISSNETLNFNNILNFKNKMIILYQENDIYKPLIKFNIKNYKKDKCNIDINFEEENYTFIKKINIFGNKNIKNSEILKLLKINNIFFKKNIFYKKDILDNIKKLENFYINKGYKDFKIENVDIEFSKNLSFVNINIFIKEGFLTKIKKVKITGDLDKKILNEIKKNNKFKENDNLDNFKLDLFKTKIENFLKKNGYTYIDIKMSISKDNELSKIVNFNIKCKNRLKINNIIINGTKESYIDNILENLCSKKNEYLNLIKINKDIKFLEKINLCKSKDINIKIEKLNNNNVNLIYNLKEEKSNSFNIDSSITKDKSINLNIVFNKLNFIKANNSLSSKVLFQKNNKDFSIKFKKLSSFLNKNYVKNSFKIFSKNKNIDKKFNEKNTGFSKTCKFFINEIFNLKFKVNIFRKVYNIDKFENAFNIINSNLINNKSLNVNNLLLSSNLEINLLDNENLYKDGAKFNFYINNLFLSNKKISNMFLLFNVYNKINDKFNLIFNNKSQILFNRLSYDYRDNYLLFKFNDFNNYNFNIRGFDNVNNDIFILNKLLNNKTIKLISKNQILIPINNIPNNNFLKNIFIFSFLDIENSLNSSKYINNHKHVTTGIGLKIFSSIGLIKVMYNFPIKLCENENIESFKFSIN